MSTGENDQKYIQLTSMLHWKSDSEAITISELDKIFSGICGECGGSADPSSLVYDLMQGEARACLGDQPGLNLENKIVLAVAIRCAAEKFMINERGLSEIDRNQTHRLIQEFKTRYPCEKETIKTLDRVALMTPENIHVNAFMYEPIVDMSDDHLKSLYREVLKLA